jgi:Enoyl-(Acyl carrier protein) reductase
LLSTIPLGRLTEPSDVATAVLFLASDEAAFLTGVCWPSTAGAASPESRDRGERFRRFKSKRLDGSKEERSRGLEIVAEKVRVSDLVI